MSGIVGPDGLPADIKKEAESPDVAEGPAPESTEEPTIVSTETKVCGCIHQKMSDETARVMFCPPHAIEHAGRALQNAGGALIMSAHRLINDQVGMAEDQRVARAAKAIDKGRLRNLRKK